MSGSKAAAYAPHARTPLAKCHDDGATFIHEECGCTVIGCGHLPDPFRVSRCAKHEAAPDLLSALKELVERRERACREVGGPPDGTDGRYARARAAIAKAEAAR